MEAIINLFKKLVSPSAERVGISICSDSKIEIVHYNSETGEIYGCEKNDLQYNQILREVLIDDLAPNILSALGKMNVPVNCPICVSVPSILTAIKPLPSDLEDVEIELALSSEAEKSYIFKKTEPKPSWLFLSSNTANLTDMYLYSIIQKNQVEKITEIFETNNMKLMALDVSFASLTRGLEASGILEENFENQYKWCIITISANNYIIAKFEGEKLVNVIENPIALRSIEQDVLYSTLNSTISEKLQHEKINNLYLVSQTRGFSAAKLAEHMKIMCKIHTIDDNKLNDNPLFISPDSSAKHINPEAIGAACWKKSKLGINMNFTGKSGDDEIPDFLENIGIKKPVHLYLFSIAVVSLLALGILFLSVFSINSFLESNNKQMQQEVNKLKKVNTKPVKKFKAGNIFQLIYNNNKELLTSYDALGAVIPEKLWIESFIINNDLNVKITGKAFNVEDIVIYFENIQKVSKFKNLKIKKIDIISEAVSTQDFSDLNTEKDMQDNELSNESVNRFDERFEEEERFRDLPNELPPPPEPAVQTVKMQNYYRFIFENNTASMQNNKDLINKSPAFVRDVLLNNRN